MTAAVKRSFDSLSVANYRRYFAGQVVSSTGNWTQVVAEVWLILMLTGSGFAVGLTTALQFLPIMLVGAWGGLLADRFAKRRLLMATQVLGAIPVLALAAVSLAGVVESWMVFALVFVRGTVIAIDNPARQSFVIEMVGPDRVVNAVSLNSVIVHTSRIAGPALGGLLIAIAGVGWCFVVNALTFGVMLIALHRMRPSELLEPPRSGDGPGAIRKAFRYVLDTPRLVMPLVMMAILGSIGLNFQVLIPLLATITFDGNASAYTILLASLGLGALIGALVTGSRGRASHGLIAAAAGAFGILALIAAAMPTLAFEVPVIALLGAAGVTFAAGTNSLLQLTAAPEMRGRVMALYTVVFLGSNPIGAPLIGGISELYDPRVALVVMASAGLFVAALSRIGYARIERAERLARAEAATA